MSISCAVVAIIHVWAAYIHVWAAIIRVWAAHPPCMLGTVGVCTTHLPATCCVRCAWGSHKDLFSMFKIWWRTQRTWCMPGAPRRLHCACLANPWRKWISLGICGISTAYLLFFSDAVLAQSYRQPVEQGHYEAGYHATPYTHRIRRNMWEFCFNGYLYQIYMWIWASVLLVWWVQLACFVKLCDFVISTCAFPESWYIGRFPPKVCHYKFIVKRCQMTRQL